MIHLVFGLDRQVAQWVREQIPDRPDFGQCTAIGVAEDKRMIAGVVFNNYRGHMIEASIAATDPCWCNKTVLHAFFAYPWLQLKVRRLQVIVAKKNKHSRHFVERLGFKFEGLCRKAMPDGTDACVYSQLRHECRWLKEEKDG